MTLSSALPLQLLSLILLSSLLLMMFEEVKGEEGEEEEEEEEEEGVGGKMCLPIQGASCVRSLRHCVFQDIFRATSLS
jgi:hypothetical protein